jgi:uncharacterized Zn finger protein (UPF0148 family)
MKLTAPLRFPLSVGSTPANLALGLAIVGFLGGGPIFFGSVLPEFMALVCGLIIAAWFFGLCMLPFSFRKERASDLQVDEQSITVHAGRFSGTRLTWAELVAPGVGLFSSAPGSGSTPPSASLTLPGGVVVRSEEPDERESLAALADSLVTLARGYCEAQTAHPPAARTSLDPRVLCCTSCGVPLSVSGSEQIQCGFCQSIVRVPDSLRVAVRDAAATVAHRSATRTALQELQQWRRAPAVNLLLGVALLPLGLAWPVMGAFTSEFFQYYDILRWRDVCVLFVSTGALSLGLVLLVQSQLVLRRAFALVTASFHARPPAQPGWPHSCRVCGAPLAIVADTPLVVCPYCQADNVVLGVLLPHTVDGANEQRHSLDAILTERRRARRRWRVGFALSLILIAAGGKVVLTTLGRVHASSLPRHAPVDRSWHYEPAWAKDAANK